MIESGLTFNEIYRCTISFPWNKNAKLLPNNYVADLARLKSAEHRLDRLGREYINQYNEQIHDMIKREVVP